MAQLRIADTPIDLLTLLQNRASDVAPTGQDRKVYIETYGCQMNVADSELMGGVLLGHGFQTARTLDEADIILINTCAVREKAEERVLGRLADLSGYKTRKRGVMLGVCGCMAEHLRDKLIEAAPYVDLVVGPDSYRRLPELLAQAAQENADPVVDIRLDREETYEGLTPVRQEGIRGWVTIQRGCDKFCTFCIVPFTRGRERGVPPREVLRQVRELAARGVPEITLLGQTVNSYKHDGADFADLLRAVVQVEGVERVRFTSPYPVDFTPKLIETIAAEPKVCKYLHLPVQSGSDRVLAEMKRGYTLAEYNDLIAQIRAAMPQVALSTDIIVGFPNETEEDFQQTLDLLRLHRFDFAYMFKYSPRDPTYAARKMADNVDEPTKARRLEEVIKLQEQITGELTRARVGHLETVMIEDTSRRNPDQWVGRTDTFKSAVMPKTEGTAPGQLVTMRVTHTTAHTLLGEIVQPNNIS